MISKALKSLPRSCEISEDYKNLAKVWYHIRHTLIYPVYRFYYTYKERLQRFFVFGAYGWKNYDWDMAYTYHLLEFKLKRLYKCLENGHAIQEPEDMAALKELIKIVRRLGRRDYENKYYRVHDKKWGKIESENIPNYDENGKIKNYTWNSWRTKTKNATKKVKEQEWKDRKQIWKNAEKDRCNDINRLADILKKHAQKFWD